MDDQLATRYAALQQRLEGAVTRSVAPSPLAGEGWDGGASNNGLTSSQLHPPSPNPLPQGERAFSLTRDSSLLNSPLFIGASKGQPTAKLEAAIGLGLRHFGENKVQEAAEKWPTLKAAHPEVTLHLIGPLQSNKAADAVALFDVIQTVDREKIAESIAREVARLSGGNTPTPPVAARRLAMEGYAPIISNSSFVPPRLLIQVNIGEEPQKAGVAPKDAAALLAHCRSLGLTIDGLMCVPPEGVNPAPYFALMQKMARELGLRELSMGMSGDFETAIRMGATMVRVGTALFGERG